MPIQSQNEGSVIAAMAPYLVIGNGNATAEVNKPSNVPTMLFCHLLNEFGNQNQKLKL
jgi:hypothetical protein